MEYSLFSDISRSKSWVLWIFVLRMQIQEEKIYTIFLVGHGYVSLNVTQQNLFETLVIFFQKHLLASQPKIVEFLLKKILKEFSGFCNIVVYFMICYSCYEVSSLQPIFSIFCIPTFMYKEMRKWYSLISFEVDELLPLPL